MTLDGEPALITTAALSRYIRNQCQTGMHGRDKTRNQVVLFLVLDCAQNAGLSVTADHNDAGSGHDVG